MGPAMADRTPPRPSFGAAAGRATMSIGLLFLAFAAYQLWGTGLAEAKAQEALASDLAATLAARSSGQGPRPAWIDHEPGIDGLEPPDAAIVDAAGPPNANRAVDPGVTEPTDVIDVIDVVDVVEPAARRPAPEVGQPFARLLIPTIDVDKTVVEGTTREALRTGPGHYRGTATPGQPGNVAIAGHRTTYGAPFRDLDRLEPGDPVVVETADGTFTYRVEAQTADDGTSGGHRIVAPEEVEVIADKGDHRLTLTACHPLYSARQRIVVTALLEQPTGGIGPHQGEEPAPQAGPAPSHPPIPPRPAAAELVASPMARSTASPRTATDDPQASGAISIGRGMAEPAEHRLEAPATAGDDLGWQPAHAAATARWAALTALVVSGAWVLGRLWRRVPAYLMAGPSFTLCLVTCFGHLDQLIPAA